MEDRLEGKLLTKEKLVEKFIGAVRHVFEKNTADGKKVPVGFSIVFYDAKDREWFYDMRVMMDKEGFDPYSVAISEKIAFINEFLSEGIKRILEGEIEDNKVDVEDGLFYVPLKKGTSW